MAVAKYTANLGDTSTKVVYATGSPIATGIEVNVDLAQFGNRQQLLLTLDYIKQYILNNIYPPA